MTQKERIEQLERELDVLRARLSALEARPFGVTPMPLPQPVYPTWPVSPQWTPTTFTSMVAN